MGVLWISGASLGRLGASLGRLGSCLGRLGARLGRPGGPFWPPLATFGQHFGSILEVLDCHLASPGEGSRNVTEIPRFWVAFWLHFDTTIHWKTNMCFNENPIGFSLNVSMVLWVIWGWFLKWFLIGFRKSLGEACEKRDPTISPPLPMKTEVGQFKN